MRLIDADILRKKIFTNTYSVAILENEYTVLNDVLHLIDTAPTVENITVFSEGADEETLEDIKKELTKVLDKLKERNDG